MAPDYIIYSYTDVAKSYGPWSENGKISGQPIKTLTVLDWLSGKIFL